MNVRRVLMLRKIVIKIDNDCNKMVLFDVHVPR